MLGKIWLSEPCIYIDITINLDISYETVDIISSAVLRGVSHEGRLIDREACNQYDVIPYFCGLLDCIGYRMLLREFGGVPVRLI